MMLIITSPNPKEVVDWLVENTNKQFVWKQLLEVLQLVCSAGISNTYKPLKQGFGLQNWIKNHKEWIFWYIMSLYEWCYYNIDLKIETMASVQNILSDLHNSIDVTMDEKYPTTAIWRYSKEYLSEYATNSELPIEVVTELYKEYIKWKFSV